MPNTQIQSITCPAGARSPVLSDIEGSPRCKGTDLIHAHWLASALPGLAGKSYNKKTSDRNRKRRRFKASRLPVFGNIIKRLLASRSEITTISEDFQQKLKVHFPNKQIHLIPNGVSRITGDAAALKTIKEKYGITGLSYSVFTGRVIALKRVGVLIDLLAKLKDSSQYLLVCGSLDDEDYVTQLKQQIDSLALD